MNDLPAMPALDLAPHDWAEVCRVLQQYLPAATVWAFGSRVTRTAKSYSDLDLAIITDQPLSLAELATVVEAFAESDLTIRVDVVDWAATSSAFREIIARDKLVIQQGAAKPVAAAN